MLVLASSSFAVSSCRRRPPNKPPPWLAACGDVPGAATGVTAPGMYDVACPGSTRWVGRGPVAGAGPWSSIQNCHPGGAGGQVGSGRHPDGGVQPAGGVGQPGGELNRASTL